jgi:hypothetical protein
MATVVSLSRGCHAIMHLIPANGDGRKIGSMLSTFPDTTLGWPSSRYWRFRTLLHALIRAVDVRDGQVAAAHVGVDRSTTMHACGYSLISRMHSDPNAPPLTRCLRSCTSHLIMIVFQFVALSICCRTI